MDANVVICGAGMAGVATAYQLAVRHGIRGVLLVDPLPPLTMTSDKSTECYRNWWPGPGDAMVQLMNRSIDIMEQLHCAAPGRLPMHRSGYLFATGDPAKVGAMVSTAEEISRLGAGSLRIYRNAASDPEYVPVSAHDVLDAPDGADLFLDQDSIRRHFPYLTDRTVALLHARRCGWFAAQQFGMYMFEQALAHGAQLVKGRVEGVTVEANQVRSVQVDGNAAPLTIRARNFVIAAGPFQQDVARKIGVALPIECEVHHKVMLSDPKQIVPRDLGLLIWNDPVRLLWSDEERMALSESDETRWLLEELPVGLHGRPEGEGEKIVLQWAYRDLENVEPRFPVPLDPQLPEVALRGMGTVLPGLSVYFDQIPRPFVDGGYYARTPENRPLIGPLPVEGAYIIGGLGGFGMMSSCGASDLLARHIAGAALPDYAPAFLLSRYENPGYQQMLRQWGASGQI